MSNDKIKSVLSSIGLPRIIVTLFFALLWVLAIFLKLDLYSLLNNLILRVGMNGILVLAMVPAIRCGIRPNFGIGIGIIGGLLGALIAIEAGFIGIPAIVVAILFAIIIGTVNGLLYSFLLNRVKGSEMTVSTYVGFSFISLMNIGWLILPFKNPIITFSIGQGLKNTISLDSIYANVINRLVYIPIKNKPEPLYFGSILVFLFLCFLMFLFLNSKTGIAMSAAGDNKQFAKAAGISENKMRMIGTVLSTVTAAIGIIFYQENFGFLQLYNAPLLMSFSAVAAILIGGASITKANISHVIIGVILFHGIISMGLPIANKIVPEGNLSEVMRAIISNGVILYSLTKAKGANGNE